LKNFVNNPPKRGYGNTTYGHLFSVPRYVEDPYDRPTELNTLELNQHRDKTLVKESPFRSTSAKRDFFTTNY